MTLINDLIKKKHMLIKELDNLENLISQETNRIKQNKMRKVIEQRKLK